MEDVLEIIATGGGTAPCQVVIVQFGRSDAAKARPRVEAADVHESSAPRLTPAIGRKTATASSACRQAAP